MRSHFPKIFFVLPLFLALAPAPASAHQPRVVESRQTQVADPEISKAYYGRLTGVPDVFTFNAPAPFALYANILVPDLPGQGKDVSVAITKDGAPFAVLDAPSFVWTSMFESFGVDTYWKGPEYKAQAPAGTYVLTVTSPGNDEKYSLAIGEAENFDFKETVNALTLVPRLKRDFFDESPIGFLLSPFGWGMVLALYVLAGVVGFLYRLAVRRFAGASARPAGKNIGAPDRFLRLVLGLALLLWAVTTTWNPFLIFLSGFALFEAVFSWCALYSALGKNTCPMR